MDALSAFTVWGYQETLEELRTKLWSTICELEEVKNNAKEEVMKKEDEINQLIHLLKQANQERDEAKNQLQILLNKLQHPNSIEHHPAASFLQPESPQLRQAWGSSSITESENLSDNQNHYSHVSSPAVVDSFLDVASAASPELSNMNRADSGNVLVAQQPLMNALTPAINKNDDMNLVYDKLAKKPLPEKGQLLEAVIGAGPLLETLFMAGSLPQWKNPPPLRPLMIPPMSISMNNSHLLQSCNGGLQSSILSPMISYNSASFCKAKMPLIQHSAGSQQLLNAKKTEVSVKPFG